MAQNNAKIIVGQKDASITQKFGQFFSPEYFSLELADHGDKILHLVKNGTCPDIVLLDHALLDPGAIQICRTLKSDPELRMIPILMLSMDSQLLDPQALIEAGCDDFLVEPISANVLVARVRSLLRIKFLMDALDSAESVLYTLARTIEAKDQYTLGHADRVSNFAVELGQALGVNSIDLEILRKGGMLHDIGKIAIPDTILTKPGKFTPEEFNSMKRHPVIGCDICQKLKSVKTALPMIRHHHERLDGTGYPDGLKGEQIPSLVRVVTIVDIYDALRSKRSYKEAFAIDQTFEIMWQEAEKGWWDKNILSTWEKIVRSRTADPFPS